MEEEIGRVIAVSDARLTAAVSLSQSAQDWSRLKIGKLMTSHADGARVVGTVSEMRVTGTDGSECEVVVELLGEISADAAGRRFSRGVSSYPTLGAPVALADAATTDTVYGAPDAFHVRMGSLQQDPQLPAYLLTDELLGKNFAVVGSTGSGKSCAVTVILRAVLEAHPHAHIVLLDPHNEYAAAFAGMAEVVNVDNLQLPCWLLDFEEAAAAFVRGGTPQEQEAQAVILKDVILQARRNYAEHGPDGASITVDTPSPYRTGDFIKILDTAMGRLDKPDSAAPYLRLRSRMKSLNADSRFGFMFSGIVTRDSLAQVVGRLLRIPASGKPLTIVDLSGVPFDIVDAVVSMLCRLTFDVALWAERARMPPVLLVCEEAHRYIPADPTLMFAAATRAIERIAKEGRKYGVSLGLVSQRPSELAPSALTQCGTIFALRLSNEKDRSFVANALPDGRRGLLEALPALRRREAIVIGEGVGAASRIVFDELAPDARPRSAGAVFSEAWRHDQADESFVADAIRRWRQQIRQ